MNNDFVHENVHTQYCVIIIVVFINFVILLEFLKTTIIGYHSENES